MSVRVGQARRPARPGWAVRWAVATLILPLAACVPPNAPPPVAERPAVTAAAALPENAAGLLRRGPARPLDPPASGQEVGYATPGRVAAAAMVQLLDPPAGEPAPDSADAPAGAAAFQAALAEAIAPGTPGRRLRERERFVVAPATEGAAPALRCAALDGLYGRDAVETLVCGGAIGGTVLRLRASMPRRGVAVADLRAFAGAIVAALRVAPGAGR